MGRITWDQPGNRRYEYGVDRGVLYLPDGSGVAWNGLTGVEEDMSSIETNAYYFDGIKYLDTRYPGDFEGTLTALTYPDEFLQFDGFAALETGVLLAHQPVYARFGLSYRTKVGTDLDEDAGYRIHILYNLVAVPASRSHKTLSDKPEPDEFVWSITGVPEPLPGYRPTVHIVLDTTKLNPFLIRDVEDLLYGSNPIDAVDTISYDGDDASDITPDPTAFSVLDGGVGSGAGFGLTDGGTALESTETTGAVTSVNPKLPPLQDLVELLNSWVLVDVIDNGDGTWTASGPPEYVQMLDQSTFQITANAKMLDPDTYEISTTHTL